MGGEWSLGVALVMEVWPNKSRAFMAGLIGAAANVGYLLVGFVGLGLLSADRHASTGGCSASGMPDEWVEMLVRNNGWRLMMLLGTLPALLTFFIRMFVPESEKWEKEKERGATSHWATQDLLGVLVGLAGPALIVLAVGLARDGADGRVDRAANRGHAGRPGDRHGRLHVSRHPLFPAAASRRPAAKTGGRRSGGCCWRRA